MKKQLVQMLTLLLALTFAGCAAAPQRAFDTENISRITFYGAHDANDTVEVPDEHLAEIAQWLGTFTVGEQAGDVLAPGSDSLCVQIEYADGKIVKNGLSTITVDGTKYYMECADAPACYMELFEEQS